MLILHAKICTYLLLIIVYPNLFNPPYQNWRIRYFTLLPVIIIKIISYYHKFRSMSLDDPIDSENIQISRNVILFQSIRINLNYTEWNKLVQLCNIAKSIDKWKSIALIIFLCKHLSSESRIVDNNFYEYFQFLWLRKDTNA